MLNDTTPTAVIYPDGIPAELEGEIEDARYFPDNFDKWFAISMVAGVFFTLGLFML